MAKRLDQFTKPFQNSRIPFLLLEVITDGGGDMVDAAFRFANAAAAALLGLPPEELRGKRFTRVFPARSLEDLAPLRETAFSGSVNSFSCGFLDRRITVICCQPRYGLAACILDTPREEENRFLAESLRGAALSMELGREGLRCLSFTQGLCALTGWTRPELLDRCAGLWSLVEAEDRPELLQALLDAAREDRRTAHSFRLLRKKQDPLWVELHAKPISRREGVVSFCAVLQDVQESHRARGQLEEARARLAEARDALAVLFDGMSSSLCLYRRDTPDGPLRPLRLGRGMSRLLGYTAPELERRQTENLFWRVHPQDRASVAAAAEEAHAAGRPLHSVCRLRTREGMTRWVALDAAWQRTEDGGELVYSVCSDVTSEREASEEVQFQVMLSELMLDQSRMMSFDYDPLEDTAISNRHGGPGRRIENVSSRYLTGTSGDEAIHPEDRARRAAMIKRLLSRPGAEALEYRANYDGQGWRWCRGSWISLPDSGGGVCRLLGRAEDVSMRKVNELRFQNLAARQKKRSPGVLVSLQLDLSAGRTAAVRTAGRLFPELLSDETADGCLCRLRDCVPGEAARLEFDGRFRRRALMEAFQAGEVRVELEHPLALPEGSVWVRTVAELAEDPETLAFAAFCTVTDMDAQRRRELLADALAKRDYDLVLTVDAAAGTCLISGGESAPLPYRAVIARYLGGQASSQKRSPLQRAAQLKTVLERLETEEVYECAGEPGDGASGYKRLRCSWLDREAGTLLVTFSDADRGAG